MSKIDPAKAELLKADFLFVIDRMTTVVRQSCELLSTLDGLSTEALLAFKDVPFDEAGQPDEALMASFAAADEAAERLTMIVAAHT